MDFLMGVVCLVVGTLLFAVRRTLAGVIEEMNRVMPRLLRQDPLRSVFVFSFLAIAAGLFLIYRALF